MKLPNFIFFKPQFVSLVITPNRVQAVKLNSAKDKAEVLAQVDLSPGIIASYRVSNHEQLTAKIKSLWHDNNIKEKYVGVVVPEFSTYTKNIKMPLLSDGEIHEALSWQIQEFLPASKDEMISDWKIINRGNTELEVLVVAILKDVLSGYIDAIGAAGLYPLVVETPSLSIERITRDSDRGKIIIYVNSPEAIIVITQGKRIVASSVVTSQNLNIILNTALSMMSHYEDVVVETVIVGGKDLTQELIENLHNNMGVPVQLLTKKIAKIDPPQMQNFLIAISLQYKDPVEPSSTETVNLLPPEWAKLYKNKHKFDRYWILTLIFSIFSWSCFLASFIVMMLLNLQSQDFENKAQQNGASDINALAAQVKAANTSIDKYLSISNSIIPFQEIINKIHSNAGPSITINSYKIDMEKGEVSFVGKALDRTSLLEFKQKLEADDSFTNVDIPISFVLKEVDIDFDIKLIYAPLAKTTKKAVKVKI